MSTSTEVLIVGAGPAGLGVAAALHHVGVEATVLDRHEVGASFRRWPEGMRLITPSFTGNQFGLVDLNAITPDTSPALSLVDEHPTGAAFADYLDMVVELEDLDVRTDIEVVDVAPSDDDALAVHLADGTASTARCVVWAAGELQYPRTDGFPGAEHCRTTISIERWDDHPGDDVIVIGGYESGIDAAVNLVARDRRVTVIDPGAPWNTVDADPSRTLSPSTHGRLREAFTTGRLELDGQTTVTRVTDDDRGYLVHGGDGAVYKAQGPPLLATGFEGSLTVIRDRFAFDDAGRVIVTEAADESTVVPGLFLAGPALAHRQTVFCFIYKFRQRFGVVARAIGERLGRDTAGIEALREHRFLLDDLSCCDDACIC